MNESCGSALRWYTDELLLTYFIIFIIFYSIFSFICNKMTKNGSEVSVRVLKVYIYIYCTHVQVVQFIDDTNWIDFNVKSQCLSFCVLDSDSDSHTPDQEPVLDYVYIKSSNVKTWSTASNTHCTYYGLLSINYF